MKNIDEALNLLQKIQESYGVICSLTVPSSMGECISIQIQNLGGMPFYNCDIFIKHYETICKCLELQYEISKQQDELSKIMNSMRG